MRFLVIFLIFLISCGNPSTVPIDVSQGVPLITVSINGQTALMILDTGGAITVIDEGYLKKLKLYPSTEEKVITGYGGKKAVILTNENEIVIGNTATFSDIYTTDLEHVLGGTSVAGILGIGHLRSGNAKIDFETNTITLQ